VFTSTVETEVTLVKAPKSLKAVDILCLKSERKTFAGHGVRGKNSTNRRNTLRISSSGIRRNFTRSSEAAASTFILGFILILLSLLPLINNMAEGFAVSTPEVTVNLYNEGQLRYLPQLRGKAQNIVYYGPASKVVAQQIHNYGFKALFACDALRVCNSWSAYDGYENITLEKSWCQYDPTSKASFITKSGGYVAEIPSGAGGWESWFSPLGPFTFRVTIPRVNSAISCDFDGIFLMSFNLWRDEGTNAGGACSNPDSTMLVKDNVYSSIQDWQSFRKVQVADMASRIFQSTSSSGLKVWYSDDNIYVRSWDQVSKLRERFAVNLRGMQPFSDGFVFEWCGTPEDNAKADGLTYKQEVDAAVSAIKNARQNDGISKPVTLMAMTGRQDVYDYLVQKAKENDFGIWTSWRFLTGLRAPPYA
jgi:hypothetical protein